ncbi:MAG TPA: hypothetical protein VKA05_05645 [Acidimicrobiales bacterium]|nr:hypothetical protein [Acidimicrobiales bacterium]
MSRRSQMARVVSVVLVGFLVLASALTGCSSQASKPPTSSASSTSTGTPTSTSVTTTSAPSAASDLAAYLKLEV